jgi:hypothetical protein
MITTEQYIDKIKLTRPDGALYYDYSKVVYTGSGRKIIIICPIHGEFSQFANDHRAGIGCCKCGKENAKLTSLERYGTTNPASSDIIKNKIKDKFIELYGVDNPSKVDSIKMQKKETSFKNYGIACGAQADSVKMQRRATNIEKYGYSSPMQNKSVSEKVIATKIARGGFDKSNSSKEATLYIRKYILQKGYTVSQCAYADYDIGLHEWGIYRNGRWVLYDLVVFKDGHRGDKENIVEILEYHGPFHYTEEDVKLRGDKKAYPWKTNNTTIKESYERDIEKECIGKEMTSLYTTIWSKLL